MRTPNRDGVAAALGVAGVQTGVHYSPALHRQPALLDHAVAPNALAHAEQWAATELSLPMSPLLATPEIRRAARACLAGCAARRLEAAHA